MPWELRLADENTFVSLPGVHEMKVFSRTI
jgi:hypothetical protein